MEGTTGGTRKRILIVDDNNDTLDLLEIFLYKQYEICTAQNGFEGLNIAQSEKFDCIITDIMMPVMDGIKFFNTLKKSGETVQIPVIAVTSFIKKISTKSLLNLGFHAVASKPLKREEILEAVQKVLGENL